MGESTMYFRKTLISLIWLSLSLPVSWAQSQIPDPPKPEPTQTDQTQTGPAQTGPTTSDPTKSDPTKSDPTKSDPTKSDPSKPDTPDTATVPAHGDPPVQD